MQNTWWHLAKYALQLGTEYATVVGWLLADQITKQGWTLCRLGCGSRNRESDSDGFDEAMRAQSP